MSTHKEAQAKPAEASSYTPVSSGLLQRKCACGGGGAAGLGGNCSDCDKKQLTLQRSANGQAESSTVPPAVDETLRSAGQPLDPSLRPLLESRFGHDFSRVRVHTGARASASAQSLGAHAYTVGSHIVLGNNQTRQMGWVLGHELAHVVQQRGGDGAAATTGAPPSSQHEHEADRAADAFVRGGSAGVAAGSVGTAVQMLKVSPGEYGLALELFTKKGNVPDDVTRLLQRSPKFMRIAQTLDQHYIAQEGPKFPFDWVQRFEPDKNGVFTKGPFVGKRGLSINYSNERSLFEPAGSEEHWGYDNIYLQNTDRMSGAAKEIGGWLEVIAHESTHALHHVTGSGPAPADIAASVRASIKEEKDTRHTEHEIFSEIQKGPGKAKLKGYTPQGDSEETWAVERDFFPSKLRRTYMEEFTMGALTRQAASKEGLTREDVEKQNAEVDKIPLEKESLDGYLTDPYPLYFNPQSKMYEMVSGDYRRRRFQQRVIDGRWEKFLQEHDPGDADFETEKEKILQAHAKAFFDGEATYTPKPAATP